MKHIFTKVTAFILIAIFISACNAVKRVPNGKFLLTKNEIFENNKVISDETTFSQLYQKPNSKIAGIPLFLTFNNWAKPNTDSTFQAIQNPVATNPSDKPEAKKGKSFWQHGISNFLKKIGEPPVIFDPLKTDKSVLRLSYLYFNKGFFDVKIKSVFDTIGLKKGRVNYYIEPGVAYTIDSVSTEIATVVLDSLYQSTQSNSILKPGNRYKTEDFENEKNRITTLFRNSGAYDFQPNNVSFDIDTIQKKNKASVRLKIGDYNYQNQDVTVTEPFKLYKISDVRIFTDYSAADAKATLTDSTEYKNFKLVSRNKLKYKPFAITNAVFITKGGYFSDTKTNLTSRYLSNLKIFNYPSIIYEQDKRDSTAQSLIAKIYLTPKKKYNFGQSLDVTHSNIQNIGISFSPSISIRNVFNGAETLEFSGRANVGSSKDFANPNDVFFNASELGVDLKLNFPRIVMPFATEKIIPKSMIPSTLITTGYSTQKNIGLDKENFIGSINYNWTPKANRTARFDLFNVQFVRNLNPKNYYNVYTSSYDALNTLAKNPSYQIGANFYDADGNLTIENGTNQFINSILTQATPTSATDYATVKSIAERQFRLTENDFILATNFSYSTTTKKDLADSDFYLFKTKIESAGSILSLFANATNLKKNTSNRFELFNLEYSEYIKTEFDFVKYWDLSREKVIAVRSFFGIAIPFGNSDNIPFSRSYYSGGSNDNRGWNPYRLGPGSTGGINDFNEANMKLTVSAEFRFKILGSLKGALFADAGNIWNVLDNTEDPKATFNGLKDLENIALGTGFGLRYDLNFFVLRFDLGFKTYNPAQNKDRRWLKDCNFGQSVLNFGINYPF